MTALVLLLDCGESAAPFAHDIAAGRVRPARRAELGNAQLCSARGLIAAMHLDQIEFAERRAQLEQFFVRGGRLAFNGHVLRPFIDGLSTFVPLSRPTLIDLALTRLSSHPIFGALNQEDFARRRGVSGFYGRGHTPPPGAAPVTGLGPRTLPVDWEWRPPHGGALFMHAGNDLWTVSESDAMMTIAAQLVAWCAGETTMQQDAT